MISYTTEYHSATRDWTHYLPNGVTVVVQPRFDRVITCVDGVVRNQSVASAFSLDEFAKYLELTAKQALTIITMQPKDYYKLIGIIKGKAYSATDTDQEEGIIRRAEFITLAEAMDMAKQHDYDEYKVVFCEPIDDKDPYPSETELYNFTAKGLEELLLAEAV